jgi:hypothetical protein
MFLQNRLHGVICHKINFTTQWLGKWLVTTGIWFPALVRFCSSPTCPNLLWGPVPCPTRITSPFLTWKQVMHTSYHSPPSNAKVTNVWNYTSTFQYIFNDVVLNYTQGQIYFYFFGIISPVPVEDSCIQQSKKMQKWYITLITAGNLYFAVFCWYTVGRYLGGRVIRWWVVRCLLIYCWEIPGWKSN